MSDRWEGAFFIRLSTKLIQTSDVDNLSVKQSKYGIYIQYLDRNSSHSKWNHLFYPWHEVKEIGYKKTD
jgi:hypothetical protein